MAAATRYKLVFFTPVGQTQKVLSALFASLPPEVGTVGQIGLYNECAFVSRGTGQFRPMQGANPAIGGVGEAETVDEEKAEVIVSGSADAVKRTIAELRKVHPYEEPAYEVYRMEDF
ncbi:hypothetical protein BDV93DRAFT_519438 [Ceratobasidium sp. AG-I]|nr:hypothetical protein BDV93DRAFT_519438 [Ceratobasidium sp. AG-I]